MEILKSIWFFFQNQILGMKWMDALIGAGLRSLGADTDTMFWGALEFFLFDTIKILILLTVLITLVTYIQSYFPPERARAILEPVKGVRANILAALLGTVTPFCSCSSIPLFMGFTSAGLSTGTTFSFLISSPMVDLGSLILLMSIFGGRIAFIYVITGLVIAVAGGTLIGKLNMEDQIEDFIRNANFMPAQDGEVITRIKRLKEALGQAKLTVKKVFPYILAGVLIGAVIHNVIPQSIVETILGNKNPFSVLLATVVGIPMYADIFGTIPVAEALYFKGVELGTILSFMMAVTALSLPSMIMLKKAIKPKLLGMFIGIVTVGIILNGYLFNLIGPYIG